MLNVQLNVDCLAQHRHQHIRSSFLSQQRVAKAPTSMRIRTVSPEHFLLPQAKSIWLLMLSEEREAKAQTSLRIRAVSPEPFLLPQAKSIWWAKHWMPIINCATNLREMIQKVLFFTQCSFVQSHFERHTKDLICKIIMMLIFSGCTVSFINYSTRVHPRMGPIHFVRKLLMFC